ncbi:hypothetical protein PRIPAC_85697 [Pristionchus pacificus]|uniref:BTB domain-containing protein n=1 Tax=Pristionchus pacificus TaxID=54126 RepID=A0A2A6BM36_PRIPA|nr:hypothetical protein PRIPAC_85697 [Pristionchus pacificus]|eukprot:PDM66980.1 BTB domain-containing protein [Pristionchus pacificus]
MEEVRLPLSQEEIVHKMILNGHRMAVKTNYDEDSVRVQLVDGEDSFVDILNIPLLLFFEFRSNQMIRTKDVWSIELKGEAVKGTDFIILKFDKSQVINIAACAKYLANNAFCDSILSCGQCTLYVNKNTLGEKSTYFKALFNGYFKEKSKMSIRENDEFDELSDVSQHKILREAMSIRNVMLNKGDTSVTTEMKAVFRIWIVTAERMNGCVLVSLSTRNESEGQEETARWIPPFSVSVKADVMKQLEWYAVEVKPSTSNRGEWEVAADDDWVNITVNLDSEQWFDEEAVSHFDRRNDNTDVVFSFGKRELFCDSKRLSSSSSFFANLFDNTLKEGDVYRVEMNESEYDEHLSIFMLIHREKYRITERTVETVLILADKYGISDLIFDGFSQLVRSTTISSIDKLRLIELTSNEKYVDEVIAKMEDWDRVCGESFFPCLSNSTRMKVLERAVKVLNAKVSQVAYGCSGRDGDDVYR